MLTNYDTQENRDAVKGAWYLDETTLEGCEILYSNYQYECYEGYGFVLLRRGGQLFEVNGSHCSCYELEGQWDEEETSKEALIHRLDHGSSYAIETDVLRAVLAELE